MFQDFGPEFVGGSLQDGVDLFAFAVRRCDLELDDRDFVAAILEANLAAGDDVEPVFQQLNGGVSADSDGHAPFLGALYKKRNLKKWGEFQTGFGLAEKPNFEN